MKKQLDLVTQFHKKFSVPIADQPTLIPKDRSDLRYKLMTEEVEEYTKGVRDKSVENIAKELADILFATYGTIIEHGLQDKIEEIFNEVHDSNISKDYNEYKMIKGKKYREADINKILQAKK